VPKRLFIGGNVVVLIKDELDLDDVSTFFIVGHGTKVSETFTVGMEVWFPWGIDNYGWYQRQSGFDLLDIYTHYRQRRPMELTSTLYPAKTVRSPGALADCLTTPLLTRRVNEVPNIDLTPEDLDIDFCEQMLATYAIDGGKENIGILCLTGAEKLSSIFQYLTGVTRNNDGNLLAICVCCSVKKGQEHAADNRAAGYVEYEW